MSIKYTKKNKQKDKNKPKDKNKKRKVGKTRKRIKPLLERKLETEDALIAFQPFEKEFQKKRKKTDNKTNKKVLRKFVRSLNVVYTPQKYSATSDFYTYINYRWLTKHKNTETKFSTEKGYLTQLDEFHLAQDRVWNELADIIEDDIKTHHTQNSLRRKHFYESIIQTNTRKEIQNYVQEYIEHLDTMRKDKANVWKWLAYINQSEYFSQCAPFTWSMNADKKNSKVYRCYVNGHTFAIPDKNVYLDPKKEHKYKDAFEAYVRDLFHDCAPNEHNIKVDDVFQTELAMMNCMQQKTEQEGEYGYNIIKAKDAMQMYQFDWDIFSKELGFPHVPDFFITNSTNYLKHGTQLLLDKWDTEEWRTYWIFVFIRQMVRLCKDLRPIMFRFYGEFIIGDKDWVQDYSDKVRAVQFSSLTMNKFLTQQYIIKNADPKSVEYIKSMAIDLKDIFIRFIERNTWLCPETKRHALKKLETLELLIGYPRNIQDDPAINYVEKNCYANLRMLFQWRKKHFISLNGKPIEDIPLMNWSFFPAQVMGQPAYVVNAFYTPMKNQIYIPIAYIQKPFVDLEERGIEYNLVNLGYTIAHELSHVLDVNGSRYDYQGNLKNWWKPEDFKKYKEIQKDVLEQYELWAKRDGFDFDARLSLGEDIADISAIAICEEFLKDFLSKNKDILPIKYLSYSAFYIYLSHHLRQKIKKSVLKYVLKTNPHPLDKYRINVPLSRSEVFRSMYNVKPGDPMMWRNTNTIW